MHSYKLEIFYVKDNERLERMPVVKERVKLIRDIRDRLKNYLRKAIDSSTN